MNGSLPRLVAAGLLAFGGATGCGSATTAGSAGGAPIPPSDVPIFDPAGAPPSRYRHTPADIHFMSGMIPHHAQAVRMAEWAPARAGSPGVRALAERILVSQQDEITLMRGWLRDVGAPVPAADATHMRMTMNGMEHDMLMPGMATDAELAQLEKARGAGFDRLFLTMMIRHHQGAVTMVDSLFASHGAAQDEIVFTFASDVYADQTTEIDRMQQMLAALPPGERRR